MALIVSGVGVLAASPAFADEGLGTDQGWGITPGEAFLWFIGVPALVFAIVIALVYGVSRSGEPRLREGQSWWTEPDYNTRESLGVQDHQRVESSEGPRTTDGGGSGARW